MNKKFVMLLAIFLVAAWTIPPVVADGDDEATDQGNDATKHVKKGPMQTQIIDKTWKHLKDGPSKSFWRAPPKLKHVKEGGGTTPPSTYVPVNWKHIKEGPSKTLFVPPPGLKHIKAGTRATEYLPPPGLKHVEKGKKASTYVPGPHSDDP